MRLKRRIQCTAALSALCVGMLFPMAVQADPEYETKQVDTYLFDNNHNDTKTTLVFKSDLPTIPYINAEDYLNTVYKANDFAATKQDDGTYWIKSATSEYFMRVNPETDMVTYDEFANFILQEPEQAADMDATFIKAGDSDFIGGAQPANYNLGEYGIDILEIDGEVYFPIATLNDMFKEIYNAAQYLDGKLYFLHSSDLALGTCYYDRKSQFDLLERSQKEADYNYNELCFMMDNTYGAPSRSKLADKILKDGFDLALDSSEKLQKAKTYLKSTSMVDYVIGLYYIGADLFDGGHMTPIQDIAGAFQAYPNSPLVLGIMEAINSDERADDKKVCGEYEDLCGERNQTVLQVSEEKVKTVGSQYTLVKEWADSNAGLYVAGDTAFFTFDNFVIPVVEQFKWSVDYAADNGYKNFVVDLSTNSGGLTQVASYMLALMANKDRKTNTFTDYNYYQASGELTANSSLIDLNLDGEFNDADKEVSYDLNFAILETKCAFSSGNLMPVRAKELGIAILGENSGGGGCALLIDFMSCGYYMNMSGMPKFKTANPETDVDLGAKPDYEMSYDEMFDPDLLSWNIHEFYGETPEGITKKSMTYRFFEKDTTGKLNVIFKEDMPSVPYIDAADYMGKIMIHEFKEEVKDGKVVVSGEPGTFTVDAEKDQVTFNDYHSMLNDGNYYIRPGSAADVPYIRPTTIDPLGEVKPTTLDLSEYKIDLLMVDGKAYFPLTTISDLFCSSMVTAEYVNGEINFVLSMEKFMMGEFTDSYVDRTALYEIQERPKDAAEYTYSEMCFLFDKIYGKPSQCEFANVIREKGFDQALETYDEMTKTIKNYLQSTDPAEFSLGLTLLQEYMFDGGHTTTNYELITELASVYSTSWLHNACSILKWAEQYPQVVDIVLQGQKKSALQQQFQATRAKVFEEKGYQKVWEGDGGCTLYRSGRTVIFSFDSFNQVVTPWFKKALDYSAENGIKNFIIDLSCNGGGDSSVLCYMAAVMKNKDRNSNVASLSIRDEVTGGEYRSNFLLDLNLDGEFDDADKEVYYDLDYALLASPFSFSCGNLTPFVAKDQGIMVMGDRSGGGACSIMKAYTADGHFMAVSSSQYFICDSGADVDLGVEVDVNLMKKTTDGQYDNSAFYDLDALGIYMNEFYGKFSNEWVDGKWYDKNGKQNYIGVAEWKKSNKGWWFGDNLGWYAKNQWQKIDGKWYFFDKEGYMEANAYRQGYYLKANGAWDGKAKVAGWKQDSKGWWYSLGGSDFLKNGWKKIDGNWYYFKATGYIAINEFVQGWWLNKAGAWKDPVQCSWHKAGSKWWYGTKDGWYAKGKSYTIDGKKYTFDKKGYTK